MGRATAFLDVALHAGCDDIFPSVLASSRTWQHVVQGQIVSVIATVLTAMAVAVEDIASGQGNFFIGRSNVVAQPNDRREREICVNKLSIMLDLLSLIFEEKNNCTPPTGYVERFIGGIQNEDFAHKDVQTGFFTNGSTAYMDPSGPKQAPRNGLIRVN